MTGEEFKLRFMPFSRKLYGVALDLMSGDTQEAEDIVQDAYMKMWSIRDRLPHMRNAETYCVVLIKNICHDRLRDSRLNINSCRPEQTIIPDTDDTADRHMETKDCADIIKRCIEQLPRQQRELITMRDVNGMDYNEIEKATGLSMVNIRVTLSRARKTLREQFNTIMNYGNK